MYKVVITGIFGEKTYRGFKHKKDALVYKQQLKKRFFEVRKISIRKVK